ncbi:MAG: hypothetical protein M1817_001892 [Caeruleum heppii]|nr:MAG: hypothetical protein M1817_001892 [Caeruleum heppii]
MGVRSWMSGLPASPAAWGLLCLPFALTAQPAAPIGDVDVAIIGGGSSGTYTAIRLQDLGKKVVLVEASDRLGSHAHTWTDPRTDTAIDFGVQIFEPDKPIIDKYLARLNISLGPSDLEVGGPHTYLDFRTGKPVDYVPPSAEETVAAIERWYALLEKYAYLDDGYFLPDPVPEELLLPFGEFAKNNGLEALVPVVALFAEGIGNILEVPAIYPLHFLDKSLLQASSAGKLRTTAARNVSLIYKNAGEILGTSVRLNTRVSSLSRKKDGSISLQLSTAGSRPETLRAKRVVAAFPQLLPNFDGWDLDGGERAVFGELAGTSIHCAIVRYSDIPDNYTLQNVAPDRPYNIADLPSVYNYGPSRVPGLVKAYFGSASTTDVPVSVSSKAFVDTLARLGLPKDRSAPKPIVEVNKSHFPYFLRVGVEQIRSGFYKKMYDLQGHRNTFYTGAALSRQNSASIWKYTEDEVIPKIVQGL